MKKVAKLVIIDPDNNYLLMWRSDHPVFGRDADLPGGTHEAGESLEQTVIREVDEETGIRASNVQQLYAGLDYSANGTHYSLFITRLDKRPAVTLSWEHAAYEWLPREAFLEKAKHAKDTYMHMVYEVLQRPQPTSTAM